MKCESCTNSDILLLLYLYYRLSLNSREAKNSYQTYHVSSHQVIMSIMWTISIPKHFVVHQVLRNKLHRFCLNRDLKEEILENSKHHTEDSHGSTKKHSTIYSFRWADLV